MAKPRFCFVLSSKPRALGLWTLLKLGWIINPRLLGKLRWLRKKLRRVESFSWESLSLGLGFGWGKNKYKRGDFPRKPRQELGMWSLLNVF
jgi:hypothetical protein